MSGTGSNVSTFRKWHIVATGVATAVLYSIRLPTDPLFFPVRELCVFSGLWAMLSQAAGTRLSYFQYALVPMGLAIIGAIVGAILGLNGSSILFPVIVILGVGLQKRRLELGSKNRFFAIAAIGLFFVLVFNRAGYLRASDAAGTQEDVVSGIRIVWGIEYGVAIATMMLLVRLRSPQNSAMVETMPKVLTPPQAPASINLSDEPAFNTKQCPKCAETIKSAAIVCRYCRHEFDQAS